MIEAYNHLISSYIPKGNDKYQVHKKSELVNIYKKIVNLSKESPYYKINLSEDNQKYTVSIKEEAINLQAVTNVLLSDDTDNIFNPEKAYVSDSKALTASVTGDLTPTLPKSMTIHTRQLAQMQKNVGKTQYGRAIGVDAGGYRIDIATSEGINSINVYFDNKSTNFEQQNMIVEEINKKEIGIAAELVEEKEGYFHIELLGTDTVRLDCATFTVSDSFDEEGPSEYFGLNQIEVKPKEAIFEMNGTIRNARQNQFVIEDTLHIKLNQVTEEPVEVKLVPDEKKIKSLVKSFVDTYNTLMDTVKDRALSEGHHFGAAKLARGYRQIAAHHMDDLESCGIDVMLDGKLMVVDDRIKEAIQNGRLENELKSESGFFNHIKRKSVEVSINPIDYLDKTVVTYPNIKEKTYINPYMTSMYSGMLFNFYC